MAIMYDAVFNEGKNLAQLHHHHTAPAIFIPNSMSCVVIIMQACAIVIERKINVP